MKKSYLSLGIAVVIATSFYSCKKKTEEVEQTPTPTVVTREEASTQINAQSEKTYNDIVDMTKSEGLKTINNVADFVNQYSTPDILNRVSDEKKSQQILSRIKKYRNFFIPSNNTISIGRTSEDGGFDFNSKKGIYSWNADDEKWDTTSLGGDVIKIQFPSDSNKTTNDACLTISKYTEVVVTKDYSTNYMPTAISVNLTVSDVKMAGLDLTAAYNADGIPKNATLGVYFKPFTMNTTYSVAGSNVVLSSSVDKDNENGHIISEGINVTMGDASKMKDPQKVNDAYFQFRDMKVAGSADIKGIQEDADTSDVNKFNKYVNMAMYNNTSGAKLATFSMLNVNNKQDLYLVYNDGSKELAENFFKKHFDKLKDFMKNDVKLN